MADLSKWDGVGVASLAKWDNVGVSDGTLAKWNGVTIPAGAAATKAYIAGGLISGTRQSATDVATLASESMAAGAGALSAARGNFFDGVLSDSTYGYHVGGLEASIVNTVDKHAYADDTRSAATNNLGTATWGGATLNASSTKGWAIGGRTGGGATAAANRFTMPAETWAVVAGAAATVARYRGAGVFGTSDHGYFGGGNSIGSSGTTLDKISHAAETTAAVAGGLATARSLMCAFSDGGTASYMHGRTNAGTDIDTLGKIVPSTDTTSDTGSILATARYFASGFSQSSATAWITGGVGGGSDLASSEKFAFATETFSTLAGMALSAAKSSASETCDAGF